MPSTPYAKLLVSLNGGATQSGGITTTNAATVQMTAESTAQWDLTTPPRWEIYAYPPGWTGPASGWTTESVASPFGGTSNVYVYLGLGPPPVFSLPALPMWGKFLFRLTVQGGVLNGILALQLVDYSTALSIVGPGGMIDWAVGEENQFDTGRAYVAAMQADLRLIDAALAELEDMEETVEAILARITPGSVAPTALTPKTVPTGTSTAVASSTTVTRYVRVTSDFANTAIVYVGGTGVTVADGQPLGPGDVYTSTDVNNANLIFCISGTAAQTLRVEVL
jgi:hypothetical protein